MPASFRRSFVISALRSDCSGFGSPISIASYVRRTKALRPCKENDATPTMPNGKRTIYTTTRSIPPFAETEGSQQATGPNRV